MPCVFSWKSKRYSRKPLQESELLRVPVGGRAKIKIPALFFQGGVIYGKIAHLEGRSLGYDGGSVIAVPSADTQSIPKAHLAVEHIVCELVEFILF